MEKQLFYVKFSQGISKCICSNFIKENNVKINPCRYSLDRSLIVNQKIKFHLECFINNNLDSKFERYNNF